MNSSSLKGRYKLYENIAIIFAALLVLSLSAVAMAENQYSSVASPVEIIGAETYTLTLDAGEGWMFNITDNMDVTSWLVKEHGEKAFADEAALRRQSSSGALLREKKRMSPLRARSSLMLPRSRPLPQAFILGDVKPLTYQQVIRMCERIQRDTGFDEKTMLIRFRTTVLTDLYDQTKDLKQTQQAAGHTNAATTMKLYVKGRSERSNTAVLVATSYGLEMDGMLDVNNRQQSLAPQGK